MTSVNKNWQCLAIAWLKLNEKFDFYWIYCKLETTRRIDQSTIWTFRHSMVTNWSIIATRAQMEQVRPKEFSLKNMKSTKDQSITYVLIQSFIEQLPVFVKQCLSHASNKKWLPEIAPWSRHYTPIFELPWQCDIMEYLSVLRSLLSKRLCPFLPIYKYRSV